MTSEKQKKILLERNRAQLYLDIVNVVLLVLDESGGILLINKKGQEILGYTERELLGRNWFELCVPECVRSELQKQFFACVNANENYPERQENLVITKEGHLRTIVWHNVMLSSENGRYVGTLSSGTDVTEAKQSQERLGQKQQALNTFFESDLIGVIKLSKTGLIESVNQYVCDLTGYHQDELIHMDISGLTATGSDISGWLQNLSVYRGNSVSVTLVGKNQQNIYTDLFVKPVVSSVGRLEYFIGLIIDVTGIVMENQRILEREKQHKKILIREIHHRIKNHLQGVVGLIRVNVLENPHAREVLEKSMMQINSLAVTYGLQSKNENGEIYLCDLLHASVEFNNNLIQGDGHRIELFIPEGRPFALERESAVYVSLIINELLFNATKHSVRTPVLISAVLQQDSVKSVRVTIENQNSQLPEDFDFESGIGLGTGLELVKELMPEHAELKISSNGQNVVAEYRLKSPLIRLRTLG